MYQILRNLEECFLVPSTSLEKEMLKEKKTKATEFKLFLSSVRRVSATLSIGTVVKNVLWNNNRRSDSEVI